MFVYQIFKPFSTHKKSLYKPFTIPDKKMVLSCYIIPAKYILRNDFVVADKSGCLVFEFIPIYQHNQEDNEIMDQEYFDEIYKKDIVLEWNKKETFRLQYRNIGQIINYNFQNDQILTLQKESQVIQINRNQKDDQKIDIKYNKEGYELQIHYGDFVVLQEICKISLEQILGWSGLSPENIDKINKSTTY